MLKTTVTNTATAHRRTLRGRAVAPWVDGLEASWKRANRAAQVRGCIVERQKYRSHENEFKECGEGTNNRT